MTVVVQEGGHLRVDPDDDAAAVAAVTTVGAAERRTSPAGSRRPVATGTGRDMDGHPVDECGRHTALLLIFSSYNARGAGHRW